MRELKKLFIERLYSINKFIRKITDITNFDQKEVGSLYDACESIN